MPTPRLSALILALALAASPGALAQAPAAADGGLSAADQEAVLDFLLLNSRDLAAAAAGKDRETLLKQAMRLWNGLEAPLRELLLRRLAWVRANLSEGEGSPLTTDRAVALYVLGPPSRIHSEPAHEWAGEPPVDLATPADVFADLSRFAQGAEAAPAAPAAPAAAPGLPSFAQAVPAAGGLAGPLPTEIWVHAVPGEPDQVRVLWFADRDGSGRYRLVRRELVEATRRISEAPARELPADLFEQVGAGGEFEALPELREAPLPLEVLTSRFKAAESKTFQRFVVVARSVDVELELEADPAEWFGAAAFWLRVEEAGSPVYQISRRLDAGEVVRQGDAWLAEFGVPLRPGSYAWTAVLVGRGGHGGRAAGTVEVPDLTSGLAMSTVTLAAAGARGGLPTAGEAASEGDLAPFQVGSFSVVPRVSGTYSRGETIAVVVQLYNAPSASLELDLWYDGQYQASLDPVAVQQLPATEIQLIDITEAYPDGSYKFVVTAKGPGGAQVTAEAAFRVKG